MAQSEATDTSHPSPSRFKIQKWRLFYGLFAAPLAWLCGQMLCSSIAQAACFPKTEPLATPAFSGAHLFQFVILLASMAICASATAVAHNAWRRTRREHDGESHTLLEIGEGRSRFMAFAGLLSSSGFMIATVFSLPAVLFVPVC